ncbi:Uncharacterised protein [Vibrio cholerae]|nr:Uncharacterised protein [Vibrio cholerae]CSI81703.1 Uncharacterised protein [Vibrio cholerae]
MRKQDPDSQCRKSGKPACHPRCGEFAPQSLRQTCRWLASR